MEDFRKRESSFTFEIQKIWSLPSSAPLLLHDPKSLHHVTAFLHLQPRVKAAIHPSAPMKYPRASMHRQGCQQSSQKMLILTSLAPGLAEWGHLLPGDEKTRLSVHHLQDLVWNGDHMVCSSKSTCSTSTSLSMPRPADRSSLLFCIKNCCLNDILGPCINFEKCTKINLILLKTFSITHNHDC